MAGAHPPVKLLPPFYIPIQYYSLLVIMTSLLIVESPAKCSKIQGFLGPGWRVIATMGHIRALEEDLDAVGIQRDFEPRFAFLKEKSKAINQLKECARFATTIYLASDDDREGEAISYSVALLLKLDPATTPRAVFREITASAVKAAVAAPRRLDMNRVWAQQARAVLDMMVGFTISPLLWKYVGQGLSAGRCQTPALRLLVDREKEITGFRAETAWRVSGMWSATATAIATGTASPTPFEATMVEELEDSESAMNYLENLHDDAGGTVTVAGTKPTTEQPPKPLITSTLQQEVSATMGIQPKNTMRIAQRLYEAGHITYMRTDSAVLSEEARLAAEELVRTQFGAEYVAAAAPASAATSSSAEKGKGSKKAKESKEEVQAQEAHEAIRPTHFELTTLPADEDWNASDRKVYKLIWNRAVQSVMAPCRGELRTVDFTANGDPGEFGWRAQWRRTTFPGWRRIGAAATNLDKEDGSDGEDSASATNATAWTAAQALTAGTTLKWRSLAAAPFESKPPARYTEATLVRELEKKGIGRPSTFAQLIGSIMDKAYAEKRDTPAREVAVPRYTLDYPGQWPAIATEQVKKVGAERQKLGPTALGLSVIEFLQREFNGLFAYEFTAQMEGRLDGIAGGKEPWKALCRDTWGSYSAKMEVLKAGKATVAGAASKERFFEGGIKAVQSKKGPLLLREGATKEDAATFYGWPEGVAFGEVTEEQVAAFVAAKAAGKVGEELGQYGEKAIVKKSGPYGTYAECDGVKVPWAEGDTEATLAAKFESKSSAVLHTIGPFEFRKGPYGIYFFKKDVTGAQRKFVGLPAAVDPKALTQEAAVKLYQTGLQQKAKGAAYGSSAAPRAATGDGGTSGASGRGGARGGRGGRGGWGRGGHA